MLIEIKRIKLLDLLKLEEETGVRLYTRADQWLLDVTGWVKPAGMDVVIIAKEGYHDDWAAYTGLPYGTKVYDDYLKYGLDMDNPVFVQSSGDKLYQPLAEKLFPNFVEAGLTYRP